MLHCEPFDRNRQHVRRIWGWLLITLSVIGFSFLISKLLWNFFDNKLDYVVYKPWLWWNRNAISTMVSMSILFALSTFALTKYSHLNNLIQMCVHILQIMFVFVFFTILFCNILSISSYTTVANLCRTSRIHTLKHFCSCSLFAGIFFISNNNFENRMTFTYQPSVIGIIVQVFIFIVLRPWETNNEWGIFIREPFFYSSRLDSWLLILPITIIASLCVYKNIIKKYLIQSEPLIVPAIQIFAANGGVALFYVAFGSMLRNKLDTSVLLISVISILQVTLLLIYASKTEKCKEAIFCALTSVIGSALIMLLLTYLFILFRFDVFDYSIIIFQCFLECLFWTAEINMLWYVVCKAISKKVHKNSSIDLENQ